MFLHYKHGILKVFFKHTLCQDMNNNLAISADGKNGGRQIILRLVYGSELLELQKSHLVICGKLQNAE
jgi:hypothetical protein